MSQDMESKQIQREEGPVTFVNPLKQEKPKKPVKPDYIITWIIRAVAILAELFFFLPLCVVSCSADDTADKTVNGIQAVFGFKLSYIDEKITGVWWLIFVCIITAWIIALWFVKDLLIFKLLKLRKVLLCFFTGTAGAINTVLLFNFMTVADARVAAANAEMIWARVSVQYTVWFILLVIIQVFFMIGGIVAAVFLIIKNPDLINRMGEDFKTFLKPFAAVKQKRMKCPHCGKKRIKDASFCAYCGKEYL